MWQEKKTITVNEVSIEALWNTHSDIKNWAKWQEDIDHIKINSEVKVGTKFILKPKGGPAVELEILKYNKPFEFVDSTKFPLAKMFTSTFMKETKNGIEVTLDIKMKGILGFLWKNIVAKKILEGHQKQYNAMVKYIKSK